MYSSDEIIEKFCRLQSEVNELFKFAFSSDCFCKKTGFWKDPKYGGTYENGYRNDGKCFEFIEKAVKEKMKQILKGK